MRLVGQSLSSDIVFREMLHLASELLGLNRGRVVLKQLHPDEDGNVARIAYAYGLTRSEIGRGVYKVGEGITGAVLATGQAIIVQNIDADPRFLGRAVSRADLPQETVAFIAVPIEVNKRVEGVLAVHRIRRRNRLISDDVSVLKMLATLTGQLLQLQGLVEEKTRSLEARNEILTNALESSTARYGIVGQSPALLKAIADLERVSTSTAIVLLLGESGSGKELFARALHMASPRRDSPFVKVNCAAIPESLFESELFGHERGAFTGANTTRVGWFEQANHGTIFLDEIGEMPLLMQTKLLRTLQEGTIVRLGGKKEISLNVRVVAATNRDLQHEVELGNFREDLFYRLNVVPIQLPSLEERREDIRALALHFLNRANQANERNVYFSPDALDHLESMDWPGNIRELSNAIERIVLLAEQQSVGVRDVIRLLGKASKSRKKSVLQPVMKEQPLIREYLKAESHDAESLVQAMQRFGNNQSRAAQSLGLTLRQFRYRWQKIING
ncbi:MAG: GAF domain-containing protein [Methylobacillus sp.]|nr:GAF domain-containing protein [Methylobacillus sp.]